MELKYFKISEFDSLDEPGSGVNMDDDFLRMIDEARGIAGIPFKINSGFRTVARNKSVGGTLNSSHLKGMAADIHCADSASRLKIVNAAFFVGFTRIGISKTFIHIDINASNK